MKKILLIILFFIIEIAVIVIAARQWPVIQEEVVNIEVRPLNRISCEEGQTYIEACIRELYKCNRASAI